MTVTLYVKTHNVTGLMYFGKTTRADVQGYRGSGVYWRRHLTKHGADMTTSVIGEYEDADDERLALDAMAFSIAHDIVDSPDWANLIFENGLDGRPFGSPGVAHTDETKARIAVSSKARWADPETRRRNIEGMLASFTPERNAHTARLTRERWTEEYRAEHSEKMKQKWADPVFKESRHDIGSLARTVAHNAAISASLTGKTRSAAHQAALNESRRRRGPTKVPAGATYLSDGVYDFSGVTLTRIKKNHWEAQCPDGSTLRDIKLSGLACKVAEQVDPP